MKIAASTPNGDTHLITEDGVDLNDLPEDEVTPARLLTQAGDAITLTGTQAVKNIISRVVYLDEPADADLDALLDEAEVEGAPADEIGSVPEEIAEAFDNADASA